MQHYSIQYQTYFHHQPHPQLSIVSVCPSLFILSGAISVLYLSWILDTFQPGGFVFWCHIFLPFHYCSWGS